ncbi:hypothetical protein AK812_SmicGene24266 [Symbiodinium microadriaticum]|uniref:Uncharacterized protein n=1 Tax=Symbiodinium microadriaticum TaxID=2951 RepID=A0A1Q9DF75_SYMMI|nr:hypothetical protein AK812_SmicGene24266 [Symbiodinium microadriaticum]
MLELCQEDTEVLSAHGAECEEVHQSIMRVVDLAAGKLASVYQSFIDGLPSVVEKLEAILTEDGETGPGC